MVIPDALKVLRLQLGHKYCLLIGRLSKEFGWNHYDTVTKLEGKRKEKAQVSYERRKQFAKLRSKAVELAEKQLAPEMDKIKLENILVNFLDPLLVIQKEYEYTTVNIKVTPSRSRATSCSFHLNINIPQSCLQLGYVF